MGAGFSQVTEKKGGCGAFCCMWFCAPCTIAEHEGKPGCSGCCCGTPGTCTWWLFVFFAYFGAQLYAFCFWTPGGGPWHCGLPGSKAGYDEQAGLLGTPVRAYLDDDSDVHHSESEPTKRAGLNRDALNRV